MTGTTLLLLLLAAWPVHHRQNRVGATGGPISRVKALWLVYAVVLWFATPLLFWTRAWIYPVLAISMLLRGLVEIPLCRTGGWRVWMGLVHDAIHGLLLILGIVAFYQNPQIFAWLVLMIISILTEILFVHWFRQATGGPETGAYFVPETPAHTILNRRTFWIALPQWILFGYLCLREILLS